jgi:ADP-ribose pyrophosphatase
MSRIRGGKKLTGQKWLNLYDIAWVDAEGRERNWQLATRGPEPKCISGAFDRPDAVVIVAYHRQRRRMVVTREYRVPLADVEYGFPAGLVDAGETPSQAAARELKEETGLTVTRVVRVGPPIYSSAGLTDESVSMVYVECDGSVSDAGNVGGEQIEVLFIDQPEAQRLCDSTDVKFDAKAWLVLTVFGRTGAPWPF